MSLIIMCGLPSAGKSTVVDLFKTQGDVLLRPEDWAPQNLHTLGEEAEKEYRIQCWKMAIEKAADAVSEFGFDRRIILDCVNAKFFSLASIIGKAKTNKHRVVLVFVTARVAICEERSGLSHDIFDGYVDNLKDSIPRYKQACDDVIVIKNDGSKNDLDEAVKSILPRLICKNG